MLNELSLKRGTEPVSASAFSQARARLKHTAFIELNQKAVVEVCYSDRQFKRYRGFRLLAIDGSKVRLPGSDEVIEHFGTIRYSTGERGIEGEHAYGLASVLYDVLNRVALDSRLAGATAYEVDLACAHLEHTQDKDLLVLDRNYPSYEFLANLFAARRQFVIRCSAASFAQARSMLRGEGESDQTVTLKPHHARLKTIRQKGLPESITVRFVRVTLSTGEYEVLVSSWLDTQQYPNKEFKWIYHQRWGIEGFYGVLKTRLLLENFIGQTVESVYQDFYATVYLTGVESLLSADTDEQLAAKSVTHPQQVNRAVSFNAIKNQALELLYEPGDIDELIDKLEQVFRMNPCLSRPQRVVPRQKKSARHLLDYWRRRRKICF